MDTTERDLLETPEASELKLGEAIGEVLPPRPDRERVDTKAKPTEPETQEEQRPINQILVGLAAFLVSCGAGWMMSGVFGGIFPKFVAIGGPLLGAAIATYSYRMRNPNILQFLVMPVCAFVGALIVLPDLTGGSANLPSLIVEALTSGGLATPPVPFDSGWKFIFTLLTGLVGATSASMAIGFEKPKGALLVAGPLIFASVLIQPPGAELLAVVISLTFAAIGFGVAYGVELRRDGAISGEFEVRRFGTAALAMIAIGGTLFFLSRFDFLLPEPQEHQTPPQKPEPQPPLSDRRLFSVKTDQVVPFRLGVLDGYYTTAWLTPPFNPARLVKLPPSGKVPFGLPGGASATIEETFTSTFEIGDLPGRVIPNLAMATIAKKVAGDFEIEYDPRTQSFRMPLRTKIGQTYVVTAPVPPSVEKLNKAGPPPPEMKQYVLMPEPPLEVKDFLNTIPSDLPDYERLQFIRTKYYERVIAAGAGDPIDVPPKRVSELIGEDEKKREATPFEITAAEVMLARWTGIPSRLGYGYYNKEIKDGEIEIRPRHGATWLEVYFEGSGWIPLVGRPPQAKSSLNKGDRNVDPQVRPTEEIGVQLHVPLRAKTITLLFILIRYWLAKLAPYLLTIFAVFYAYPGILKYLRRFKRKRWAAARGPRERIGVAYAEIRDLGNDMGIGYPALTPLEYLDACVPDKEHRELAWLMTRCMWGDLVRDARPEDAEAAVEMATSVYKRLARAQGFIPRAVAFSSRISLRQPWSTEMPNLWWKKTPMQRLRDRMRRLSGGLRGGLRALRRLIRRPSPQSATAVVLVVATLFLTSCVQRIDFKRRGSPKLLPPIPAELGGYKMVHETGPEKEFEKVVGRALVGHDRLYTIREGEEVVGSLEVSTIKPGIYPRGTEARAKILQALGQGRFALTRVGDARIYTLALAEFKQLLWFDPDGTYYLLMIAKTGFEEADRLFVAMLSTLRGEEVTGIDETFTATVNDPRRGSDQ